METGVIDQLDTHSGQKVDLDGARGILTMGIIALPFSFGLVGIILSIITLTKSARALKEYQLQPTKYTDSSLSKVKSGKVCAIVSLSLFVAALLILVIALGING